MLVNVRRLAALDMYGTSGSARWRRLIRAEFIIGVVGCGLLGVLTPASGSGWTILLGIWLVATGLNYVPLAISAQALSRPGALEAELVGVNLPRAATSWRTAALDPRSVRRGRGRNSAAPTGLFDAGISTRSNSARQRRTGSR